MKHILVKYYRLYRLVFIFLFVNVLNEYSYSQGQEVIELKYSDYSLLAPTRLNGISDAKFIPFFLGKHKNLPKNKSDFRFGMFFRNEAKSMANTILLDIIDAETNQSLKKISLDEYFGKENASWKILRDEPANTPEKIVSVYQMISGNRSFKFVHTIESKINNNLPLGRSVNITFAIESAKRMRLTTKFFGIAEGKVNQNGATFSIASNDTSLPLNPDVVCGIFPPSSIQLEPKKDGSARVNITTNEVPVTEKNLTAILSFTIAGTSVPFEEHIAKQSQNIEEYFLTQTSRPELIAVTTADKQNTVVGDTITYVIQYHNIGTAAAKEISLNNQIPHGTIYIEESATGKESTITLSRTGKEKNASVTAIIWKFIEPILPGENRTASFRVKVL